MCKYSIVAPGARKVGREAKPPLKLGVCGEHGGDPDSIQFFQMAGLDYVSCSPYRVPIARGRGGSDGNRSSEGGRPTGGDARSAA